MRLKICLIVTMLIVSTTAAPLPPKKPTSGTDPRPTDLRTRYPNHINIEEFDMYIQHNLRGFWDNERRNKYEKLKVQYGTPRKIPAWEIENALQELDREYRKAIQDARATMRYKQGGRLRALQRQLVAKRRALKSTRAREAKARGQAEDRRAAAERAVTEKYAVSAQDMETHHRERVAKYEERVKMLEKELKDLEEQARAEERELDERWGNDRPVEEAQEAEARDAPAVENQPQQRQAGQQQGQKPTQQSFDDNPWRENPPKGAYGFQIAPPQPQKDRQHQESYPFQEGGRRWRLPNVNSLKTQLPKAFGDVLQGFEHRFHDDDVAGDQDKTTAGDGRNSRLFPGRIMPIPAGRGRGLMRSL